MSDVYEVALGPDQHGQRVVRLVRVEGGTVLASDRGNRAHMGAWAAGARAALQGLSGDENPYRGDRLDTKGRISLGRRAFRAAWRDGFDTALEATRGRV